MGQQFYKFGQERIVFANLVASDTYCPVIGMEANKPFSIITLGTWTTTLTLQKSLDYFRWVNNPGCDINDVPQNGFVIAAANASWIDVANYTENQQLTLIESEEYIFYRLGFKAAAFASGSAYVRISA